MWTSMQMENIFKGIVRDVQAECTSRGVNVGDGLASYVIKFALLNPKSNFIQGKPLRPEDLRNLVYECSDKLCNENSPSTACLRMQAEFEEKHRTREEIIEENASNFKKSSALLIKDIINTIIESKEQEQDLYHKLVVVLTLLSGLGNPHQTGVLMEATAALRSMFPQAEMKQFLELSRKEKEIQIHHLTKIVAGIRLYNRDIEKGGEGIEDLPSLLERTIVATKESIGNFQNRLVQNINILTTALEVYLEKRMMRWDFSAEAQNATIGEEDEKLEEVLRMKETLIAFRQIEIYLRQISDEVDYSNRELLMMLGDLNLQLMDLRECVQFKTVVPTAQIFPKFVNLAGVWRKLQDELLILSSINDMIWILLTYMQVSYCVGSELPTSSHSSRRTSVPAGPPEEDMTFLAADSAANPVAFLAA